MGERVGILATFSFSGFGSSGTRGWKEVFCFLGCSEGGSSLSTYTGRILVFFSFWEQRDEWLKGGVLCFRVTFVLSFARLLEAVLSFLIFG